MHPFLLTKLTEASKSQKNDSKFSTKNKTMTMPLQNLFRYISFKMAKKLAASGFYMKKNVAFTLISFTVLK